MFNESAAQPCLDLADLRWIEDILIEIRSESSAWDFDGRLRGWPVRKKPANKWFLGCLLDYQIPVERAWGNALLLAEDLLGNPNDLWGRIDAIPEEEWMELCVEHSIHRFPQAYRRIRRIGRDLLDRYAGDARLLWDTSDPSVVLDRLHDLRVGEQLSRMVVAALRWVDKVHGPADIKADVHTRRVLGRFFLGRMASTGEATVLSRSIHAEDPSEIDFPLWMIGHDWCAAIAPACTECPLLERCSHAE